MVNIMNIFKIVLVVLVVSVFSACSPAQVIDENINNDNYLLPTELQIEALNDIEFLEPYIERNVSKLNYGFLYIEDENGNPVKNLKCYNEGEWYVEGMEGAGKHSSISMPGGIIPVSLVEKNEKVFFTIVNEEAENFVFENIEADYEKLLNGEIYKVVWKHETPEESVLKSERYVTVKITPNPKYDISRFTVRVVPYYEQEAEIDPEGEMNPAMGTSFDGTIKIGTLTESNQQIGDSEKVKLFYIGKDGTVVIKAEDIPKTEKIKFIVDEMDSHIIAVPTVEEWEVVFESGKNEYIITFE